MYMSDLRSNEATITYLIVSCYLEYMIYYILRSRLFKELYTSATVFTEQN